MRTWAVLLCLGHASLVLLSSTGAKAKRYDPAMVDPLSRRSSLDKNFMRFGRSSPSFTEEDKMDDAVDTLTGPGTEKNDNFPRSMRAKDNFIRFGRGWNDNFIRYGRGKQDSFMRFGKSIGDELFRYSRGKQDRYMRFGRGKPNFMRFGRANQKNYMRFGRSSQGDYMRFGKGMPENPVSTDNVAIEKKSRDSNLIRYGRQPPSKNDGFIRFGRNAPEQTETMLDLIPPRLKRSASTLYNLQDEFVPNSYHDKVYDRDLIPLSSFPYDLEEEYSPVEKQNEYVNRKKRLISYDSSTPFPLSEDKFVDATSSKHRSGISSKLSLSSAGLSNVVVPEFTLLSHLDPPSRALKIVPHADQNFPHFG